MTFKVFAPRDQGTEAADRGVRRRRRRRQRRQQHDRGRPRGRRVRRRQHRRPAAGLLQDRPAHPARRAASPRAWAPAPTPKSACRRPRNPTTEIGEHLDGAHMVFITAGMGGGTGTGAGPIIAKCARERGILTVGVVTKPFHFEGRHRMRLADAGIAELQRYVDTLIVIPNQNLFRVANERTTFAEAFAHGRPGAAFGRPLDHRPDGAAGPDQPRLRRRPHGDDRDGQGDDGHRRGVRRRPRADGGGERHPEPAARRSDAEGRQGRAGQHHRRPRHDPAGGRRGGQRHLRPGRSRTPTSSSAPPSIRRSGARCASRWSPPAWTAPRSPPSSPRRSGARVAPHRDAGHRAGADPRAGAGRRLSSRRPRCPSPSRRSR